MIFLVKQYYINQDLKKIELSMQSSKLLYYSGFVPCEIIIPNSLNDANGGEPLKTRNSPTHSAEKAI